MVTVSPSAPTTHPREVPMKIALYGAGGTVGSASPPRPSPAATRSPASPAPARPRRRRPPWATSPTTVTSPGRRGPRRRGLGHRPEPHRGSHDPWLAAVRTLHRLGRQHARRLRRRRRFPGHRGRHPPARLPRLPRGVPPEARTGAAALDAFRAASDEVDWTFFSPAPVIAPGERTGRYTLGQESPVGDADQRRGLRRGAGRRARGAAAPPRAFTAATA